MVLMAVALELAKPLSVAAAFNAFRRLAVVRGSALALLATVAIAFSLSAALTLMATARTDLLGQRAADAKTAKSVYGQRDRIEAELARLAGVRPAATVKAEIGGLLADPRVGDCGVIDGPRSKATCPRVATLKAELGKLRKGATEANRSGLQSAPPAATDKADAGAHAIAIYLAAIGLALPDRLLTEWLVLVSVVALEIGAALALVLVQSVGGTKTEHQTPRQTEQITERPAQTRPGTPQTASTPQKLSKPSQKPTQRRQASERRSARRTERHAMLSAGSATSFGW